MRAQCSHRRDASGWHPGQVTIPIIGKLELRPAALDLLAPSVADVVREWQGGPIFTASIDPELSDTAAFCAHYDVPMDRSANCVVVTGRRDGQPRWAAVVVLATTRADVNGTVRRRIDVRKVSFAPMADAVEATGMEYGGITPIGLPAGWPVLIDRAVAEAGHVIIGSGIRRSKIVLDGAELAALPGAEVIDGLAD